MTTECQQWKKRYQTDTTCKVQCGAAQEVISGIALPSIINLFPTATPSSGRRLAYNDQGTDYSNSPNAYDTISVSPQLQERMQFADFLVCVMSKCGFSLLDFSNGDITYSVLVDENLCNHYVSSQTPQFMQITLTVSMASATDPMVLSGWLTTANNERVVVMAEVYSGPATAPPYGVFELNYHFVDDNSRKGYLKFFDENGIYTMAIVDQFTRNGVQIHSMAGTFDNYKVALSLWTNGIKHPNRYASDGNSIIEYRNDDIKGCYRSNYGMRRCWLQEIYNKDGSEVKTGGGWGFTINVTGRVIRGYYHGKSKCGPDDTERTWRTWCGIWIEGNNYNMLQNGTIVTRMHDSMDFWLTGVDFPFEQTGDWWTWQNKSNVAINLVNSDGVYQHVEILFNNQDLNNLDTITDSSTPTSFNINQRKGGISLSFAGISNYECLDATTGNWVDMTNSSNAVAICTVFRPNFYVRDGDVITSANGSTYHLKNQECTQWLVEASKISTVKRKSISDNCNALKNVAKSIGSLQNPRAPYPYGRLYFPPWTSLPTVPGTHIDKFIDGIEQ
tara:strand:- start:1210 stop:2886 length:1677 start_codon:yes stop_codon:yes gene_type:complete